MSDSQSAACQPTPELERDSCDPLAVSALCEKGWRPILLTGFLLDEMTRHFSPHQVEEYDLRRYIWRNNEQSGILIETATNYKPLLAGKRPAILVQPNERKQLRLSIGDVAAITGEGFKEYLVLWTGSHTLFCVNRTGASVELLATEVQRQLTQFSPVIREYLQLQKFQVLGVGAISQLEEATENFVVPITVGWAYQEKWRLQQESLTLRKIIISCLSGCDS